MFCDGVPHCKGGTDENPIYCREFLHDICTTGVHGNGIPIGMGFTWESHGNRSSFWATNGNGNGIGNNVMGMGMAQM